MIYNGNIFYLKSQYLYKKTNTTMYKNFNLTEEERKQILEQHSAYGYRKPLNEEKLSSLISESMVQAQMAIGDAKSKMSSGEKPDSNTMGQIKQCITQKQLTSLMFLTTGAGAYALGIVAILIAGGAVTGGSTSVVGMVAGGTLAVGSIITLFITGLSEKDGGLGADPSRDVKALLSCMGI
jgi:hypothetical protein